MLELYNVCVIYFWVIGDLVVVVDELDIVIVVSCVFEKYNYVVSYLNNLVVLYCVLGNLVVV